MRSCFGANRASHGQDLQKGDAFLDEMFRAAGCLPADSLQMPWAHSESGPDQFNSPLPAAAFSGVHVVEVAGS